MFNNRTEENTDSLPKWTNFLLKDRVDCHIQCGEIFMDHYLILILQNPSGNRREEIPPTIFAFDLRNNKIQEVQLDASLFDWRRDSIYIKYKENQIIRFGDHPKNMARLTIESFEPLSVKCEEIKAEGEEPNMYRSTAQIYKDFLYVYGTRQVKRSLNSIFGRREEENDEKNPEENLWSFDLNTLSWKECQPSGEKPEGSLGQTYSCIVQDNLFFYGSSSQNAIFMINLNSLTWTKIQQKETDLLFNDPDSKALWGVSFKDHLLLLRNLEDGIFKSKKSALCCWDINTKSWSTFDIQRPGYQVIHVAKKFAIYKNFLVVANIHSLQVGSKNRQVPFVSLLDLDYIGLSVLESPEQKRLRSLFMNEEESDIKLKIQDQMIPAHKQVLINKSRYFANLFNSGMSESKQDIIEIPDCDYSIFQEFLRFLYYDEVKKDEDLAIKLFIFADKYVQNDLREKCVDFLKVIINQDNVYKILDFARQEDISHLRYWCINFLKDRINSNNISGLVEYLNKQDNPEFAQENLELRDKALSVLTDNFAESSKDQKTSFFEDFMIQNIALDTIITLVNFISARMRYSDEEKIEEEKEKLKPHTVHLRAALYDFVQRNLKTLTQNKIIKKVPHSFLVDLVQEMAEEKDQLRKGLHGHQQTSQ